MGGQACVSYGAAEFSRDLDLAIVASLREIEALRKAMVDLQAEVIAVPPFDLKYRRRGHAVHFRCHHPEAEGLRVGVMSRRRGVDSFEKLWSGAPRSRCRAARRSICSRFRIYFRRRRHSGTKTGR